jgi:predicted amidohydrolase
MDGRRISADSINGGFMTAFDAARNHDRASADSRIGRPVRVVSIGFRPGRTLEAIAGLVDRQGATGTDLIILPETCRGQDQSTMETLDGATIRTMAALARQHRTYIVCPVDRLHRGRRLNSAAVLDRRGEIVCVYDKMYPLVGHECVIDPPVSPGRTPRVFQADFGKVGLAICFDVNWPGLWQRLADQGAELVVWPSAYSAARAVQAHAINHHYYIVTATWIPDCRVFDIDGSELVHDHGNAGDTNVTAVTLDLDRAIFHFDFNHPGKLEKLLEDHGESVEQDKRLPMEAWFVLQARRPGVSARNLAGQYGLEELRPYIRRCQSALDKRRMGPAARLFSSAARSVGGGVGRLLGL